ncbi:MAG: hypothetical protein WA996_04780 [Candidatus Promineifilaceae bacterium]
MIESSQNDSQSQLAKERKRLVGLADIFEPLLTDPGPTSNQIQDAIEELRAIRMRIHEIDRRPADKRTTDYR